MMMISYLISSIFEMQVFFIVFSFSNDFYISNHNDEYSCAKMYFLAFVKHNLKGVLMYRDRNDVEKQILGSIKIQLFAFSTWVETCTYHRVCLTVIDPLASPFLHSLDRHH